MQQQWPHANLPNELINAMQVAQRHLRVIVPVMCVPGPMYGRQYSFLSSYYSMLF